MMIFTAIFCSLQAAVYFSLLFGKTPAVLTSEATAFCVLLGATNLFIAVNAACQVVR